MDIDTLLNEIFELPEQCKICEDKDNCLYVEINICPFYNLHLKKINNMLLFLYRRKKVYEKCKCVNCMYKVKIYNNIINSIKKILQ